MSGERGGASIWFGGFNRFELYSIRFDHLAEERKGLKSIEFFGTRFFTLYKRRDGAGAIPVGKLLYFSSPRRLSEPTCDPLTLTFGDPDWGWIERFGDRQEVGSFNTIKTKIVVDRDTDSRAVITYEYIRRCIEAEPKFVVEDPQQRGIKIKITHCNIFAFTNNNDSTKRLLKHVGLIESAAACGKGKPVVLDSGDQIKLDRPVLAIPLKGELQLLVSLKYSFSHEGKEEEGGTIQEFCVAKAPRKPKIESMVFTSTPPGGFDLKLDISWYDSDFLEDEDWDLMDDQDDEFWDLTDHAEEKWT